MLKPFKKFTFIKGDISDKAFIDKLFDEYKFDIVVNLAAQAGVRYSIDHPDVYIQSNIIQIKTVLLVKIIFGFVCCSQIYLKYRF